jgi:hypothetical protein
MNYPYQDGDFTIIGPECFAGEVDGKIVISWRGENYVPQKSTLRIKLHNWWVGRQNRRLSSQNRL